MMNEQLSEKILEKISTIEHELTTIRTEQTHIIDQLTTMAETQNAMQQHITTLRINQMKAIQELIVIKQLSPGADLSSSLCSNTTSSPSSSSNSSSCLSLISNSRSNLSSTQLDHEQTSSDSNVPSSQRYSVSMLKTIDQRLQLQEYSIHLLNQRQLALESELALLKNK